MSVKTKSKGLKVNPVVQQIRAIDFAEAIEVVQAVVLSRPSS